MAVTKWRMTVPSLEAVANIPQIGFCIDRGQYRRESRFLSP
jgi:hypothetical protein